MENFKLGTPYSGKSTRKQVLEINHRQNPNLTSTRRLGFDQKENACYTKTRSNTGKKNYNMVVVFGHPKKYTQREKMELTLRGGGRLTQ